jgi:hypothetical protein
MAMQTWAASVIVKVLLHAAANIVARDYFIGLSRWAVVLQKVEMGFFTRQLLVGREVQETANTKTTGPLQDAHTRPKCRWASVSVLVVCRHRDGQII